MAERRPIVVIGGVPFELPTGDTLPGVKPSALSTIDPIWALGEDASTAVGKFSPATQAELDAINAAVVHNTGNETGLAGNKTWSGNHIWDFGADGKAQIIADTSEDTPLFGLFRSGDTLPRVGISAANSFFGVGVIIFTNGTTSGASIADNGTSLLISGRDNTRCASFYASGSSGATATPMIAAGGTASGAPSSGAHLKGELVCDDAGVLYRCTVAGTPGTWVVVNSSVALQKVAGGAAVENIGAVESNVQTVGATGSTETLDTSVYGVFDMTMDQACTFTFSNPAPSGKATIFTLILRGAFTPTWPGAVDWHLGTPPTYTTPAVYTFMTVDAGTTWLGMQGGRAFA